MLETLDYKIPMTTKAPLPVISVRVRGAGRGVGSGHCFLAQVAAAGRLNIEDTTVTATQESEVNILATWNRSY